MATKRWSEPIRRRRFEDPGFQRPRTTTGCRQLFEPAFVDYLADQKLTQGRHFSQLVGVQGLRSPPARPADEPAAPGSGRLNLDCPCGEPPALGGPRGRRAAPSPGLGFERLTRTSRSVSTSTNLSASVEWSSPPEDVATAARAYRREAGSPLTVVFNAVFALIFTGIIVGIPAFFLAVVADAVIPLELYAAGVAVVFAAVTVGFFIYFYRGSTKVRAVQLGLEAFLRGYAERRGMRSIDPAQFLALNPRLELPGTVQTALVGPLPGSVEGALATCIAGGKVGAAYWLVAALRVAPVEGVPYASLMPRVAEEDDGIRWSSAASR